MFWNIHKRVILRLSREQPLSLPLISVLMSLDFHTVRSLKILANEIFLRFPSLRPGLWIHFFSWNLSIT